MTTFVDTNVLVYARDTSEPDKQPAAQAWMEHLWNSETGRTSTQVLNEYVHAALEFAVLPRQANSPPAPGG